MAGQRRPGADRQEARGHARVSGQQHDLPDRAERLRKTLAQLETGKDAYEYVFIDCPPSLGLLTVNALAAADSILIPLQCEYFALEGISELTATLQRVKRALNPALEIEGDDQDGKPLKLSDYRGKVVLLYFWSEY